ncbi:hypothetical protein JT220_02795 [Helicobacter pylori]|nr:hypothetical protein [Helicobacter pylori]
MRKQSNKLFSFLNGIKWRDLRLIMRVVKLVKRLANLVRDFFNGIFKSKVIPKMPIFCGDVKCEDFNALRSLVYLSVLELEETINSNKIPF